MMKIINMKKSKVFPQHLSKVQFNKMTAFSIVCKLIDHINDVIKCSKLKLNHERLGEQFQCTMINKSTNNEKMRYLFFYN